MATAAQDLATVGLFVRLEANPQRIDEVLALLRGARTLVDEEPATIAWFAIRLGPTTFGIFDAFPDEQGRQAHLAGRVASALRQRAPELFAEDPDIRRVDVIAAKLP